MLEKKERQITSLSAPADLSNIVQPTTLNVIGASIQTAFFGTGTLFADLEAAAAKEREKTGTPMSKEDFDNVYGRQYKNLKWTEGMTQEGAAILSAYEDQQRDYESVLSRASNLQSAAAFVPSFVAAMIETKNAGIELGVQAGVSAAAFAASKANPITAAYLPVKALARTHKILTGAKVSARTKFAYGAGLGVVSAGIAEPSNISSAETLQQDYDYVDTLMNIASSSMLGGTIEAAPTWVRSLRQKFGSKAFDVHAAKMDTAAAQMAEGQPIDLSYPEAAATLQMIEWNASVDGKKIIFQDYVAKKIGKDIFPNEPDDSGLKIFLGVNKEAPLFNENWSLIGLNSDFSKNTKNDLINPTSYVVRDKNTGETMFETNSLETILKIDKDRYDAVPLVEHMENLKGKTFGKKKESLIFAQKVKNYSDKNFMQYLSKGVLQNTEQEIDLQNFLRPILSPQNSLVDNVFNQIKKDAQYVVTTLEKSFLKEEPLNIIATAEFQKLKSFENISEQAQQFKTDHDNIMRMIEAGEVDTISAAAYKAELAGLDPDSLDNGFLELQNCLLGI
jgi:hypothetical protein